MTPSNVAAVLPGNVDPAEVKIATNRNTLYVSALHDALVHRYDTHTALVAACERALRCLPNAVRMSDVSWEWCWNELSEQAQAEVVRCGEELVKVIHEAKGIVE